MHRQILTVLKLNSRIEDLLDEHKESVALPAAAAKELLDACCTMCHVQGLLFDHFSDEPVQLFNTTLKTHDLIHLALLSHQINPRVVWNFCGESYMGILKLLGANCVKGLRHRMHAQRCCITGLMVRIVKCRRSEVKKGQLAVETLVIGLLLGLGLLVGIGSGVKKGQFAVETRLGLVVGIGVLLLIGLLGFSWTWSRNCLECHWSIAFSHIHLS